jgi:Cdc6-like AAA superfamily ATPase
MNQNISKTSLDEALAAFTREIGVAEIAAEISLVGNRDFIKFQVGRECPLYDNALFSVQKNLSDWNIYKGALGVVTNASKNFPESVEARALLTLLSRSTREVSQGASVAAYRVPYVPFQQREDHTLAQPAAHIVRGRRGVGKSTLIRRAVDLLKETNATVAVIDMQSYSTLSKDELLYELFFDICSSLASSGEKVTERAGIASASDALKRVASQIISKEITLEKCPIAIKRALTSLTNATNGNAYVFLDDFHLVEHTIQPEVLHSLLAALKGANSWLKIIGISSLLNVYDPRTRKGLQTPGDAQFISLDLTLENPEAAENHLRSILQGFLNAVGYSLNSSVMPDMAFQRLAWANAGVPRDFLQMFARSLEHASRNRHSAVTLSDINVAMGEFGQQKLQELDLDARNEAGIIRQMLDLLEHLCLEKEKINAFLIRSGNSKERFLVQILSDLRLVHLIHQSITPKKAGERFEAFILDYSLFTGFRRRPNVREMIPIDSQFKAAELRALPKIVPGFFESAFAAATRES